MRWEKGQGFPVGLCGRCREWPRGRQDWDQFFFPLTGGPNLASPWLLSTASTETPGETLVLLPTSYMPQNQQEVAGLGLVLVPPLVSELQIAGLRPVLVIPLVSELRRLVWGTDGACFFTEHGIWGPQIQSSVT